MTRTYCQRCERPSTYVLGVCSECGHRSRPTIADKRRAAPTKDLIGLWLLALIVAAFAYLIWALVGS